MYTVKANVLLRHFYYFKTAATSCTAHDSYKNMIPKLSCEERQKRQGGEIVTVLFSFSSFFTLVLYLLPLSRTVFFYFSIWFSSSDGLGLALSSLCYFFNSPPHPTSFLSRPFFLSFLPQQCEYESVRFPLLQSLTSDLFAHTDSTLQDIRSCLARQLASFNVHHWSKNSLAHTTWSHDGKL